MIGTAYSAGLDILGDGADLSSVVPWYSLVTSAAGQKSSDFAKQKELLAKAAAEQKSKDRQALILYGIMGVAVLATGAAFFTMLRRK